MAAKQIHLAVMLGFLVPVLPAALVADEVSSTVRWQFTDDSIAGNSLQSVNGTLNGIIRGKAVITERPSALCFDGTTNHISWPTSDLPSGILPRRECSFEAWVKVDRVQEWGAIVGAIQDNGDYERGWLLGFRKSRFCFALASENKQRLTYLTASEEFVPGAWYHVVGTYDGGTMQLFVDGKLVARSVEQSGDIAYPPLTWLELGAYHDDNELYLTAGKLAEVGIYDAALTDVAVGQQFAAGKHRIPDVEPLPEQVTGWPTYMHDNRRSGVTQELVTLPLYKSWEHHARLPPTPAWPPPANQDFWHNKHGLPARVTYDRAMHLVSDGERVYFGSSSEDQVFAISLQTGQRIWSYFTDGPVRLAPSVADGKVYFGSDDGSVYCVHATTGTQVWRYQAKEGSRRIPGNGRIISLLPIRSGVLLHAGQARFAAGLFPLQGTYQYALDMQTGKELAKGKISFSPQGYMQQRGGSIMVAQGRAPTTTLTTVAATKTKLETTGGPLAAYPLALIRAGDVRFAGGKGKVAAFDRDDQEIWSADVTGAAYSLAVADNSLLVSTDQGVIYRFTSTRDAEPRIRKQQSSDSRPPNERISQHVTTILRQRESKSGYCLLIGDDMADLGVALARRSQLRVLCTVSSKQAAEFSRHRIDQAGFYGQVTVQQVAFDQLPYASGLFNVLVCTMGRGHVPAIPVKEVFRLLRPGDGKAVVLATSKTEDRQALTDWSRDLDQRDTVTLDESSARLLVTRPPLADAGRWTHMYAGPSNTSCSEDALVKDELALQWFGEPGPQYMLDRHHRTVPPLYMNGIMFVPGNDRVYGVDAYNGTVLWNVEVANSRRVAAMRDAGSMAASKEYLYIAAGDRCYGLASETGAFLLNIPVPALRDGKTRDWGYVAYVNDQLFGSATKPEASRDDHSREQIKATYYDFVPLVTSDAVFSMNRHNGANRWKYESSSGAIINSTITIGGNRIYFVESTNIATLAEPTGKSTLKDLFNGEANIVALDLVTGDHVWRVPFDLSELQHQVFMSYAQEKLVVVGTKNKREGLRQFVWYDLHGFDATDGKHIWSATQNQRWGVNGDHGEQDHHPTIVGDTIYQQPYAYDLHTGKRRNKWQFARGGHGCGALSASASAVFFRAANPTMCDLETGMNSKVTQVSRPGCWINMIPAGGLLMIPEASSGCTCNFPIQASMVFAPAGDF